MFEVFSQEGDVGVSGYELVRVVAAENMCRAVLALIRRLVSVHGLLDTEDELLDQVTHIQHPFTRHIHTSVYLIRSCQPTQPLGYSSSVCAA